MREEVLVVSLAVKAVADQRETHEESHETDSPDPSKPCPQTIRSFLPDFLDKLTIGPEHVDQFSHEVLSGLLAGNTVRLGLFSSDNELLGFRETSPDNSCKQGQTGAEEVDCSPVVLALLNDSQIDDCKRGELA